ncbi:unnamed protein product, partial [Ectocarpus sp. 8 AP-2014]
RFGRVRVQQPVSPESTRPCAAVGEDFVSTDRHFDAAAAAAAAVPAAAVEVEAAAAVFIVAVGGGGGGAARPAEREKRSVSPRFFLLLLRASAPSCRCLHDGVDARLAYR